MTQSAIFVGSYSTARQIPSDNRPQIAFAGKSNVGKSTLLNILTNQRKLAKTSKTPGLTRLLNFFLINDRYYYVDLPGYGYARASIQDIKQWNKLTNDYLEFSPQLKAVLFLLDCRREPDENDLLLLNWLESKNLLYNIILTKADKLGKNDLNKRKAQIAEIFKITPLLFSALSGIGRKELLFWIDQVVRK